MFYKNNNWMYRGEGNSTVALSLPKDGKVVCIRKELKSHWMLISFFYDIFMDWFQYLCWLISKITTRSSVEIGFYSKIMNPLIGREYVSNCKYIFLPRGQILHIEKEIEKFRPFQRKHKKLKFGPAILMEDFGIVPLNYIPHKMASDTYAIEIKPKQGWRPLSEKMYDACIYCMNQYVKLQKGDIKAISQYCPEDLFSGNYERMMKAIKNLIAAPQNNFKFFKNGQLIYGENMCKENFYKCLCDMFCTETVNHCVLTEFCSLVQKSLIRNLIAQCDIASCQNQNHVDAPRMNLPKNCVLERILSLQMLSVENCNYYAKLMDQNILKDDTSYVEKLLKKINKSSENICIKCLLLTLCNNSNSTESELMVVPYLISAVASDCSLMVALRKIKDDVREEEDDRRIIKTKFGDFALRIGVFDLHPKPMSTIEKHVERNNAALEAYLCRFASPSSPVEYNKCNEVEHQEVTKHWIISTCVKLLSIFIDVSYLMKFTKKMFNFNNYTYILRSKNKKKL